MPNPSFVQPKPLSFVNINQSASLVSENRTQVASKPSFGNTITTSAIERKPLSFFNINQSALPISENPHHIESKNVGNTSTITATENSSEKMSDMRYF
jgi:hypothetical protein